MDVDKSLEAYNEELELPMHKVLTKEQIIKEGRKSIKEYADRVLGHKAMQRERKPSGVQRIMTNGGCVYRVKVK